jgi:hypothetical protein
MRRILSLGFSRATPRRTLLVLAALLVGAVAVALVQPAAAQMSWCWGDPVISLNGQRVSIAAGVAGDPVTVGKAVQRAETTVYVPAGVSGEVLSYTTEIFKDKKVTFVHTDAAWQPGQSMPVTVVVSFKAKTNLPVQVVIDYPGGQERAFSTTLGDTILSFTLPAR